MVDEQIAARGIGDARVLAAMRDVPRHEFVPPGMRGLAYADRPLPIGRDQTISQPYIVAIMTELAAVDANSVVLEVGTGSGYQAAVLAEIARQVYSIEIIAELAETAAHTLSRLGYDNVAVRHGDEYVTLKIVLPERPDPELEEFAQRWQAGKDENPRRHLEA